MTGLGIEYSPCTKCDKTKCSFCELAKYKNSQKGCQPENRNGIVEVVRCKDCKHFQPDFVWTDKGERRPYTEEEIKNGKIVTGDIGINCASRCERFGYWDENRIPVWFAENDFCSYGERKVE